MEPVIEVIRPSVTVLTPLVGLEKLLELAGRTCYKSEDKITPESAEKFVRMICKNHHESVLEHATVTVKIVCSRACSHQLVRHRLGAYSQESQRYCNYGKREALQVIAPPSLDLALGYYDETCKHWWVKGRVEDYREYIHAMRSGMPPEDARYCLPNASKTEIVTTFNLRQWRHVFKERALNKHAQWEIRLLMGSLLTDFIKWLPCVFSDLTSTTS